MAGRQIERNNFTKGVLDPLLRRRTDMPQYAQGMVTGRNVVVMPTGGFYGLPGRRHKGRLRRRLRPIHLSTSMMTAPKGGTLGFLLDGNLSTELNTSSGVNATPWVFLTIDLGAATAVAALDIIAFRCEQTGADAVLQVQSSTDNSTWLDFGTSWNIRTSDRSRRAALPPGEVRTARYWRLAALGNPNIGRISVKELAMWQETTRISTVKSLPFSFNKSQTYAMMLTDRNIDVFRGGVWQAAISVPHRSEQIAETSAAQDIDTMFLFHADVPIWTVLRSGAHDEWNWYEAVFVGIPDFASGTAFGVTQDEVQQITVSGISSADKISIGIEDRETTPVTIGTVAGSLATSLTTALRALPNVGETSEVLVDSLTATDLTFRVRFLGVDGARQWPPAIADITTNDAAISVTSVLQDGRVASGDIIGKKAGYPSTGTFWQNRLYLGGIKLRPSTVLGTKVNAFDFTKTPVAADMGIEFRVQADEMPSILSIFPGRHLQIFTDIGEFYVTNRSIDATQPINVVLSTRQGSKRGVGVVNVDGASYFVSASGNVLREYVFSLQEDDYTAEAASLLASHLLKDVASIAYRRADDTSEANQVFIVNADGTGAPLTIWRSQQVMAFSQITDDGAIRDIVVDSARDVYFVTERTISGQADNWLSKWEDESELAASVAFDFGSPQTTISGLGHLEGREVHVVADGDWQGTYTVAAGAVTLPRAVTSGEVGLWEDRMVEINPVRLVQEGGIVIDKPVRVFRATVSVHNTGEFEVVPNGGEDGIWASVTTMPDAPFVPLRDRLVTGDLDFEDLPIPPSGRLPREGRLMIRQTRPSPLTVLAVQVEVA